MTRVTGVFLFLVDQYDHRLKIVSEMGLSKKKKRLSELSKTNHSTFEKETQPIGTHLQNIDQSGSSFINPIKIHTSFLNKNTPNTQVMSAILLKKCSNFDLIIKRIFDAYFLKIFILLNGTLFFQTEDLTTPRDHSITTSTKGGGKFTL